MSDWEPLRKFTQARIGLGRAGYAVPTAEHLKFQMDHAYARDAIHLSWDVSAFRKKLTASQIKCIELKSSANNRTEYLKRPDLGRKLSVESRDRLKKGHFDLAIIISNGLSSSAVNNHAFKFLKRLLVDYKKQGLKVAPIFLVENARVAISDEIGLLAGAKASIILLGERPGLTASDSLALYLTYAPTLGNTDAKRNCISNIRPPEGLSYEMAVIKSRFLIQESLKRKLSGVELKDETDSLKLV